MTETDGTKDPPGTMAQPLESGLSGYQGALHRLLSLVDYERMLSPKRERFRYDLGRMEMLLTKLGNPHLMRPTVHIAGTKGKGSIAAMCASVLSQQGYRTGLFISPHLHTFRERICLDGIPVAEEDFADLVDEIWPTLEWVGREGGAGGVTMFEALTAMAFCYFRGQADIQVLEVGLGGRLDTTNLASPSVCAISSLSLDHTGVLGNTIQMIATEKAGIIKPGVTVVVAPQQSEAMAVIESGSRDLGADLIKVGKDIGWTKTGSNHEGQRAEVRGRLGKYDLVTPLLGNHQLENLAVAMGVIEVLQEQGIAISAQAVGEGVKRVHWPCRMEVLGRSPLIICDGAHNPHSVTALCRTLPEYFDYDKTVLIVGISEDKDVAGIGEAIASFLYSTANSARSNKDKFIGYPQHDEPLIIATNSRHPRAVAAGALVEEFSSHKLNAISVDNVSEALGLAQSYAGNTSPANPETLVLITGSLFVAAEAREAVLGIEPELYPEFPSAYTDTTPEPIRS